MFAYRDRPVVSGGRALAFAAAMLIGGVAQAQAPAPTSGVTLESAITQALRQNANIQLSRQSVEANRGSVLQARGIFDAVASASASHNRNYRQLRRDEVISLQSVRITPHDQITETTTYRAGVDQTLESGVALGGAFVVSGVQDNAQRIQGIPPQTTANLQFTLKVPLLKNAGRDTVTATLAAAGHELDAANHDFSHTNAQIVLNVTLAYWEYVGRTRLLDIATESERRARQLLAEMQRLVNADQLPRAELELISASAAEKTATRVAAEQSLADARRNLSRLLGVSSAEAVRLPAPLQDFPDNQNAPTTLINLPQEWIDRALGRRADLLAELARELAVRTRVTAARNNLKPQLDLNFAFGYITNAESVAITSLETLVGRTYAGPVVTAGISYQFPVRNSAAEGLVLSQSAALDSSLIRQRDLRATIGANVEVAAQALRRAALQLREAREAVGRYATALKNERTKRELGTATLIDVLNVEDRYNNALTGSVSREQAFANAIAQLRFEAGLLVNREGETYTVRVEDLISHAVELGQ
ncbi:MAG: TolC family protein [Burkholderiales bacterium]